MRRGAGSKLADWFEARRPQPGSTISPAPVTEAEFEELKLVIGISESHLRRLLRESGTPLAPLVEGVRQHSLDDLHRTLAALAGEYELGDPERRGKVRRLVRTAQDHARLALNRLKPGDDDFESRRALKSEVLLWIQTWLQNPPLFSAWASLRLKCLNDGVES